MRQPLTDRQQQIFNAICFFYESHLYPPTIRDIAGMYKMSIKGAYDHIKAIKKKGWLLQNSHIVPIDTVVSFNDYDGHLDK